MKKKTDRIDPWKDKGLLSETVGTDCPMLVSTAIAIIEEDYAFVFGIDEVASQLEVTKSHLIRTFTAATGISPGKYLTYIRMNHAKSMLCSDLDVSLEVIAGACGYSCANYFSKVFKKHTGFTSREYARVVQEGFINTGNMG